MKKELPKYWYIRRTEENKEKFIEVYRYFIKQTGYNSDITENELYSWSFKLFGYDGGTCWSGGSGRGWKWENYSFKGYANWSNLSLFKNNPVEITIEEFEYLILKRKIITLEKCVPKTVKEKLPLHWKLTVLINDWEQFVSLSIKYDLTDKYSLDKIYSDYKTRSKYTSNYICDSNNWHLQYSSETCYKNLSTDNIWIIGTMPKYIDAWKESAIQFSNINEFQRYLELVDQLQFDKNRNVINSHNITDEFKKLFKTKTSTLFPIF